MAVAAPALAGLDTNYGIKDHQTFGAAMQQMADQIKLGKGKFLADYVDLAERSYAILELPNGQGLLIK